MTSTHHEISASRENGMEFPLHLRRSARIKTARERKEAILQSLPIAPAKQTRPLYSYERACHGQLIPIEKRLPRHRFHRGALPGLAPDHWLIVARTRWYMFHSLVGSHKSDAKVPPTSAKYGLEARTPSHEWWLAQPVPLLIYWLDIMGLFSYLDHRAPDHETVLHEPKTREECVQAVELLRVKLVMYKIPHSDDQWEVADNARPYIFIPDEFRKIFGPHLKADLDRHSSGVSASTAGADVVSAPQAAAFTIKPPLAQQELQVCHNG